jgi:hypothetical protein
VTGKDMQDQKFRYLSKNRYYLGTKIKSQLRAASYSVPCTQRDAAPNEKEGLHEKRGVAIGASTSRHNKPRKVRGRDGHR